jgi:ribonucleoside-triphosphate reductase
MEIAKESLERKREIIEYYTEHGLYPYTKFYLRAIKEQTGKYWANHFSTIGLVGMNEAIENLIGVDITTAKGQLFAEEVLEAMRTKMREYKQETGSNYNLEATPAEGTSYRLAKLDRERFPDILTAGDEVPYYTNSTQLPVNYTEDIFEELDLQDGLQTKYTGGTVVHLFLGERIENGAIVKRLVKTICENYRLPYFTFSPTFSVCPNHGYIRGETHVCPHCKHETEVYSRVVGYLRPVKQWNDGKRHEFSERKTFTVTNNHEYTQPEDRGMATV